MPIFRKTQSPPIPTISTPSPLDPTRRRRTGEVRARPVSILISPPQVSERESSLYKHDHVNKPASYADASYEYALSKVNVGHPSQLLSSSPPSLSTSSSSSPSRSSSYRSHGTPNVSRPATWFTESEVSIYSIESDNVNTTLPKVNNDQGYGNHQLQQQPFVPRSKFVEQDYLSVGVVEKKWKKGLLASFSSLDLNLGLANSEKEKDKKPRFRGFGMSSEIWTKSTLTDTATIQPTMISIPTVPIVPPRSQLRPKQSPSHRIRDSPPPRPTERNSSLYLLPVDAPLDLDLTPSLSSGSSSDHDDHDKEPRTEPEISYTQQKRGSGRGSIGGDPMKIRDGAMSRKASSGLYTPPTFPGAQGPRPSHFPSHVYTPQTFALFPNVPSPALNDYPTTPIPTRSVSASSSTSNESASDLRTPSSSRFGMEKTLSSIRRISNHITHTQTQSTSPIISNPTLINLPSSQFSPTGSYFPTATSTPSSGHTSWSSSTYNFPTTPLTKTFGYTPPTPGGLAVGPLDETDGTVTSVEFDEEGRIKGTSVKMQSVGSPVLRGRRKPVPKILDLELDMESAETERVGVVHAL